MKKTTKQYLEYLEMSGIQDIFFEERKMNSTEKFEKLKAKTLKCKKCELAKTRNNVCFGNGNPNADLMLIGEAPGAEEDKTGNVFVGRAGKLLTKMLQAINLEREDIYIANTVKCRPPENRDPKAAEKIACLPYLEKQIAIIQPKIILLVGRVAAINLLKQDIPLKTFRETTHLYQGIKTYVSYHPSALLRNPNWKRPAWEDLQKIQQDLENLK